MTCQAKGHGNGDVQLNLTQQVPIAGGVLVTGPEGVARNIPTFENIGTYVCPGCGERAGLFGHGGGGARARETGIPFLDEVPLVRAGREGGGAGRPIATADLSHRQSRAFREFAMRVRVLLGEKQRATGGC